MNSIITLVCDEELSGRIFPPVLRAIGIGVRIPAMQGAIHSDRCWVKFSEAYRALLRHHGKSQELANQIRREQNLKRTEIGFRNWEKAGRSVPLRREWLAAAG